MSPPSSPRNGAKALKKLLSEHDMEDEIEEFNESGINTLEDLVSQEDLEATLKDIDITAKGKKKILNAVRELKNGKDDDDEDDDDEDEKKKKKKTKKKKDDTDEDEEDSEDEKPKKSKSKKQDKPKAGKVAVKKGAKGQSSAQKKRQEAQKRAEELIRLEEEREAEEQRAEAIAEFDAEFQRECASVAAIGASPTMDVFSYMEKKDNKFGNGKGTLMGKAGGLGGSLGSLKGSKKKWAYAEWEDDDGNPTPVACIWPNCWLMCCPFLMKIPCPCCQPLCIWHSKCAGCCSCCSCCKLPACTKPVGCEAGPLHLHCASCPICCAGMCAEEALVQDLIYTAENAPEGEEMDR